MPERVVPVRGWFGSRNDTRTGEVPGEQARTMLLPGLVGFHAVTDVMAPSSVPAAGS